MRKQISSFAFLFLFATVIFFNSCKKQDSPNFTDKAAIAKVSSWLGNQKSTATESNSLKIQQLEDKLDYAHLYFEKFRDDESFIVVPVKEGLETMNNKDKHPVSALLLIENQSGKIRRGNIVQYIPEQRPASAGIPKNSLFKIFDAEKFDVNAQFSFLTITDRLVYEVKYKDSNIVSSGVARAGRSATSFTINTPPQDPIGPPPLCNGTDWYLVTTYYYEDGSTSQTEEFLYNTCEPISGGSGGGGNGNDTEFEYEMWKYADLTWDVYLVPFANGGGLVTSWDRFYGRINLNHPDKNKFLSGTHINNRFLGNNGTFDCDAWGITFNSPISATAVCGGKITFPDQSVLNVSNSKVVAFSSLSWF